MLSRKKPSSFLIALILFLLLTGCRRQPQDIIPLSLDYKNFTIDMRSFGVAQVKTNFKVTNPNPFPVQGEASYKFYLGEQAIEVFSGKSSRLKMAARQTKELQLQNQINLLTIFSSLKELLSNVDSATDKYLPFSLEGKFNSAVSLGWFNIPVSVPISVEGKIPLPKAPTFKIDRVKFGGVSLYPEAMVKIGVDLTVRNRNDAALNLTDFGYQLYHDNKKLFSGTFPKDKKIPAKETSQTHFSINVPMEHLSPSFVNELKAKRLQAKEFVFRRMFNDYPRED